MCIVVWLYWICIVEFVFSGGAIDWPNEMNTKCREGGACGASGIINWFAWFSVKSSLDLFIIFPLRNCHEDLGFLYPSYPEGRTYHWLDTGKKSPQWRRRSAAGLDLSGIFGRMSWTQCMPPASRHSMTSTLMLGGIWVVMLWEYKRSNNIV